jgi:hypothetical protein
VENVIQIPAAEEAARPLADLGTSDRPYRSAIVAIPYAAPYLGRVRMLQRLTVEAVVRFSPIGTSTEAPESLRVVFELCRGPIAVYRFAAEVERELLLGSGEGYYPLTIDADFNNPIPMQLPDNLGWRFSGSLKRQEGKAGTPTLYFFMSTQLNPP